MLNAIEAKELTDYANTNVKDSGDYDNYTLQMIESDLRKAALTGNNHLVTYRNRESVNAKLESLGYKVERRDNATIKITW